MKNLIDVQAKLFINYVETLNSIQNLYVSSDKLSEYKRECYIKTYIHSHLKTSN